MKSSAFAEGKGYLRGVSGYQRKGEDGSNNITGNVKDCKSFDESSNLSLV